MCFQYLLMIVLSTTAHFTTKRLYRTLYYYFTTISPDNIKRNSTTTTKKKRYSDDKEQYSRLHSICDQIRRCGAHAMWGDTRVARDHLTKRTLLKPTLWTWIRALFSRQTGNNLLKTVDNEVFCFRHPFHWWCGCVSFATHVCLVLFNIDSFWP